MSEIVREGYLRNGYEVWRASFDDPARAEWLDAFRSRLTADARVLELGCGSSPEFDGVGVDLVARAAGVIEADITEVDFPAASFDACLSLYVLGHVPRERLAPLFERMHRWLAPGGWILHTFAVGDTEAWAGEWLGAPTFFSSFPADVNSRLVREAGFTIERDELVPLHEPEGDVVFQWILARR